jgi:hypothetical protein
LARARGERGQRKEEDEYSDEGFLRRENIGENKKKISVSNFPKDKEEIDVFFCG